MRQSAAGASRGGNCMRTLMYHDIAEPAAREAAGFPGSLAARYKLTPAHFEAHLDAVAATGLDVGLPAPGAPAPAVCLSFDDGGASAPAAAAALERRGWRGAFFVTTGRIGGEGFMTAEEVRALALGGHLVGSHSHSHPTHMGLLGPGELAEEWRRSREILGEILGEAPLSASVPGGYLSRAVAQEAADAGYSLLFTSEPTARAERVGALEMRGRYTIWASTPARTAGAYARGELLACGRLFVEWNAKKLAKRINPDVYQRLRRVRAARW